MKRVHPYLVQTSLGAAQAMAKVGVEFVPMPITSAEDHVELADQMVKRLQQLAQTNDVAHGQCSGLAAAVMADATASIDEELLAAVAVLRSHGLSNLAQAVATAHTDRATALQLPLVASMPSFEDYPASMERDLQAAFKQAIEGVGGKVVNLVVELPNQRDPKYWESYPEEEGECFEHGKYLADVRSALEAQGLQVKP